MQVRYSRRALRWLPPSSVALSPALRVGARQCSSVVPPPGLSRRAAARGPPQWRPGAAPVTR
eukprot:1190914-Prorocentrum_minimum.AAC.2